MDDSTSTSTSTSTRLKGKVALVTGAASGIGAATARHLAKLGAYVVATDIRVDEGRALASLLGARGEFRRLDVREPAQWETITEQLERTRGLDILVNNAGTHALRVDPGNPNQHQAQDPEHCGVVAWREVNRTNVEGMFLGCRHAIMTMKRLAHDANAPGEASTQAGNHRGGVIVNIAANSARVGMPHAAAYAASQAALLSHTKSVALYCAEQGYDIRCNALVLGPILTRMWDPVLGRGPQRNARMDAMSQSIPAGRFGRSDEVAKAVAWLASEDASFMNGAELTLDGGMSAGPLPRALPQAARTASEELSRNPPPQTYEEGRAPLWQVAR